MTRSCLLGCIGAILSLSVVADEPKVPPIKIAKLQNKEDSGTTEFVDGVSLIRIKCPSGIGHCTATVEKKETWSGKVALLLDGFDELEQFQFSYARVYAQGSRISSGKFEFYLLDPDKDFNKRSRIGTLDVVVEKRKDGILVTFPEKLFAEADSVEFGWINWLRR